MLDFHPYFLNRRKWRFPSPRHSRRNARALRVLQSVAFGASWVIKQAISLECSWFKEIHCSIAPLNGLSDSIAIFVHLVFQLLNSSIIESNLAKGQKKMLMRPIGTTAAERTSPRR